MAKTCPYCQKYQVEDGDTYCEHCGNKLPPLDITEGIWDPRRAKLKDNGWIVALLYGVSSVGVVGGIGYLLYLVNSSRFPDIMTMIKNLLP